MAYCLTFDDGPGPGTPAILDLLSEFNVKATFFIVGERVGIDDGELTVKRAMLDGHRIANHSTHHRRTDTGDTFLEDVELTDAIIRRLAREEGLNADEDILVRLPYGEQGDDPRAMALAIAGRTHVAWTASFGDWLGKGAMFIAQRMCRHVEAMEGAGLNSTLLLHDGSLEPPYYYPDTQEGLRLFLNVAKKLGWQSDFA